MVKLKIQWDWTGDWIRFFHDNKQYIVPKEAIEDIKESAIKEYKKSLRKMIGL